MKPFRPADQLAAPLTVNNPTNWSASEHRHAPYEEIAGRVTDPVARLEAWCDKTFDKLKDVPRTPPEFDPTRDSFLGRLITAYRTIITEYRTAETRYHTTGEVAEFGYDPEYDTWYTTIKILADTHNPEKQK
jgi:hypothetical protein